MDPEAWLEAQSDINTDLDFDLDLDGLEDDDSGGDDDGVEDGSGGPEWVEGAFSSPTASLAGSVCVLPLEHWKCVGVFVGMFTPSGLLAVVPVPLLCLVCCVAVALALNSVPTSCVPGPFSSFFSFFLRVSSSKRVPSTRTLFVLTAAAYKLKAQYGIT